MPRQTRASRLETRTSRLKLKVASKPTDFTPSRPARSRSAIAATVAEPAHGFCAPPTARAAIRPATSASPTTSRTPTASDPDLVPGGGARPQARQG